MGRRALTSMKRRFGASDRRSGFTLIELAVVMVVIGVLAGIAIPNYVSMTDRTRRASCISNQRNLVPHATLYAAAEGITDGVISVLDMVDAGIVPRDLAECPLSLEEDWDDYTVTMTDAVVTDVGCLIEPEEHPWEP